MKKVLPYMKKTYDWALLPLLDYLSKILLFYSRISTDNGNRHIEKPCKQRQLQQ